MMKYLSKLKYFVVVMIVIILATLLCGITIYAKEQGDGVRVAHITDLHYYPTYMAYSELNADYISSTQNTKSVSEMRLITESSENLRATLEAVKQANPEILLVTGDLTSDGERQGLIDVANALRKLQNDIRSDSNLENNDFQIAVIAGNHDISNPSAKDYSTVDGSDTCGASRSEFATIFAGLGYPDMSESQAFSSGFYSNSELNINVETDKFLPYKVAGSRYVESSTAKGVQLKSMKKNSGMYKSGDLSYIMRTSDMTILGLDTVLSNNMLGADGSWTNTHIVGGELGENVQQWVTANMSANDVDVISIMHHNLLEHFTMQEEIMEDFTLKNFEEAREFLIDKNVKYNFSGHLHSNDVASFVSYEGRTIYDITTASNVGFSASYRISDILFNYDRSSDLNTTAHKLAMVDYSILIDNNYLEESIIQSEHASILVGGGVISSAYDYGYKKIYSDITTKIISQIVTSKSMDAVKSKLVACIEKIPELSGGIGKIIKTLKNVSPILVDNLHEQINSKVLADYNYSGSNRMIESDDKLTAFLNEMCMDIMSVQVASVRGKTYDMQDLLAYAYGEFMSGGESSNLIDTTEWFQKAIENLQTGVVVADIEQILLDRYYPYIQKLFAIEIDISQGLNAAEIAEVNSALNFLSTGQSINKLNIDKVLTGGMKLLGSEFGKGVAGEVDEIVKKYSAKSAALKLSDYLIDVTLSMSIDTSFDGKMNIEEHIVYKQDDILSHAAEARLDINPAIADGRLPSMITTGFGNSPSSDKEIVWLTDKRIKGSDIQYMKGSDITEFDVQKTTRFSGEYSVYSYEYSLLNLPIFATSKTKEIARHSISLKGLDSAQNYLYRIGDESKNFWSKIGIIKTAPKENNVPFEIMIVSDMLGSTERNFNEINQLMEGGKKAFINGDYEFIINLGNTVQNPQNLKQWRLALDTSSSIYSNKTVVLACSNDDQKYSVKDTDRYGISQQVVTEYNTLDLHYNIPHGKTNAKYYSFDYSGVHFTVVDTNDMTNSRLSKEQLEWLENDLISSVPTNKVVLMNKGIYTASAKCDAKEIVNMRENLAGIFSENGVDIVLQSGGHSYSESYPINSCGDKVGGGYKSGAAISNKKGGVLYVGIGTAGDDFRDYMTNDEVKLNNRKVDSIAQNNAPTFGKLSFNGSKISYSGYMYNVQNGEVTEITDSMPWWGIMLIVLIVVLGVLLIALVTVILLQKNGKIHIDNIDKILLKLSKKP